MNRRDLGGKEHNLREKFQKKINFLTTLSSHRKALNQLQEITYIYTKNKKSQIFETQNQDLG